MSSDRDLVARALRRDPEGCRALIDCLTPVIRRRVARALARGARHSGRPPQRSDVLDLVQEVFVLLLDRDGRVLRQWDPERGLSLENFVGLVAEREAGAILRSGRRSAWAEEPAPDDKLELRAHTAPEPERIAASRQQLGRTLASLRASLSPRNYGLFEALYIHQQPIEQVAESFGMTPNALYTFRSRLKAEIAKLRDELTPIPAGPSRSVSVGSGGAP